MTARQIVALGGGGFAMDGEPSRLDQYLLDLSEGSSPPRVCFVGTASGDSSDYIERFYAAFPPRRARASHLRLFRDQGRDYREFLLDQDIIYVGGGNTLNMLAIWRARGIDQILRDAYEAGVILAGMSAGAVCWFEGFCSDSANAFGRLQALRDGLGLLRGSACPHFETQAARTHPYLEFVQNSELGPGYAIPNHVALHFRDGELLEAVADRAGRQAERVVAGAKETGREMIPTRLLGPSAQAAEM